MPVMARSTRPVASRPGNAAEFSSLHEFEFYTKVSGEFVRHFHVEPDQMAVAVDEYKRQAINQHAYPQHAAFLD